MAEGVVHLDGVQLRGVVLQHFFSGGFGRVELGFPGGISPTGTADPNGGRGAIEPGAEEEVGDPRVALRLTPPFEGIDGCDWGG